MKLAIFKIVCSLVLFSFNLFYMYPVAKRHISRWGGGGGGGCNGRDAKPYFKDGKSFVIVGIKLFC